MKEEVLILVIEEVVSCFTEKEMKSFKNFEDFFQEIDVINAYEPEWNNGKGYKSYYKKVWKMFLNNELTFGE